jgi:hypothetical protein
LLTTIKKYPAFYSALILPFYIVRYCIFSIKEKSFWFYRYYPGHYGSTIPSWKYIKFNRANIFSLEQKTAGVELNEAKQVALLQKFTHYFPEFTPEKYKDTRQRYYYDNPLYGFTDGFILFAFLRMFQPSKVVEIGSGFSSALMLDTAESFSLATDFIFIDPYTRNFEKLSLNETKPNYKIVREKIQDIDLSLLPDLQENDILFIDSSHVLKIDSDLSYLFFSLLPSLNKGVIVHVHDIWWPFEYPVDMIKEGRVWNEIYFIRCFLQYNSSFEILFFNSFMEWKHKAFIDASMPDYFKDSGKSLWLRKTQ